MGRLQLQYGLRDVHQRVRQREERQRKLRWVRSGLSERLVVPERLLRLQRRLIASVWQLRHPVTHVQRRHLVGVVGVLGSGDVRAERHRGLRRERNADLQRELPVGRLQLQQRLHAVQRRVRQSLAMWITRRPNARHLPCLVCLSANRGGRLYSA